ncbi:MAG: GntR family transcriptional regulator [Deltaproteobacteria bacterium]|nr:GntR family transcriptional regulator [Deltaproteobacteria bacterium]MBU53053.1 GntR family transcriptional regulator [Deltaproteobacteria bacterium]
MPISFCNPSKEHHPHTYSSLPSHKYTLIFQYITIFTLTLCCNVHTHIHTDCDCVYTHYTYLRGVKVDIQLNESSGIPFYRQIKDQIAALIRTGHLEPGMRLPSVRELTSTLLVSLITVRRAYADLEAERLIVRRQGQGTFVSEEASSMSKEQRFREGRDVLEKAVESAFSLGLASEEVEQLLEQCLETVQSGEKK